MKKSVILLMLALIICSSVFAECNLDTNRWKHMVSTKDYGLYCDIASIIVNDDKTDFKVWECEYYPGNYSKCPLKVCNDKGLQTSEHYHYFLVDYNYKNRTVTSQSFSLRDSNGNILVAHDIPSHLQKTKNVIPNTTIEALMLKIKEYIDNQASSLSARKEGALTSIVINNVSKEEVQKQIYQIFKQRIDSPAPVNISPAILEDNAKISFKLIIKNEGYSLEDVISIFSTQQGKDVLLKGETISTKHYADGKVSGPVRTTFYNLIIETILLNTKAYFNGRYIFGFGHKEHPEGHIITEIVPGSPFDKKGIKVGDIIISINGNELKNYSSSGLTYNKILDGFSSNERIFVIKHNGETKQYTIKPKYISAEEIKKKAKS